MKIEVPLLHELAKSLETERKRQKLSREEAASVCGVSASFIRDVEANPESCSLGKLVRLINGLGLSLNIAGLPQLHEFDRERSHFGRRPDFGVADEHIVGSKNTQKAAGTGLTQLKTDSNQS